MGVAGALPCYRREALEQAGLFDERFFSYKEDVDMAFRLRHAGWASYHIGGARSCHERGLGAGLKTGDFSVAKHRRKKSPVGNYLSYRNHCYVLIKDVALRDWMRYGIVIGWYELQKIVYLFIFEQKTLYAWVEIVKALPRLWRKRRYIKIQSVRKWVE